MHADKYRKYGEDRWFFFTTKERKHAGGNRPNRTTPDNGHWNATGSPEPVRSGGVLVGSRRTMVFYEASRRKKKNQNQHIGNQVEAQAPGGLPPAEDGGKAKTKTKTKAKAKAKAEGKDDDGKTEWTMYEYESLSSEAEFEASRAGKPSKVSLSLLSIPFFHLSTTITIL